MLTGYITTSMIFHSKCRIFSQDYLVDIMKSINKLFLSKVVVDERSKTMCAYNAVLC